jgi:DNA modification methylase
LPAVKPKTAGNLHAYKVVKIAAVQPYDKNPRTHSPEQVEQLRASIRAFGFTNPLLLDEDNKLIAGHGRLIAAGLEGLKAVPAIIVTGLTDTQRRALVIADNQLALNADWDPDLLAAELAALTEAGFDMHLLGMGEDELAAILAAASGPAAGEGNASLAERFLIPPFSVFNAREGWWQERKRAWLSLGIKSELGRTAEAFGDAAARQAAPGGSPRPAADYSKNERGDGTDKKLRAIPGGGTGANSAYMFAQPDGGYATGDKAQAEGSGTSIFDPVLCEIAYRWFCPAGGTILDPFAGGSVRGIVAAKLGRQYVGCDLSATQIEANRLQASALTSAEQFAPVWACGDSKNIEKLCKGVEADFVFSCPPYADLERYSDDAADLSTLKYPQFREAYRAIIAAACRMLKADRFACFVVGEVRGSDGNYYNFVGDTVAAFIDAGLKLYNEAILVTAVGSLPIRAAEAFSKSRKLGKTHQNVLVFVKGDAKKATAACGNVEISLPDEVQML